MIATAMLKKYGLQIDTAGNGLEALEAVKTRPYDLVLMDIGMPEMDGIEATALIRQLNGNASKTPIIAMTAHVMNGDREKILSQGLDDYISKPIIESNLITTLKKWLGYENLDTNKPQKNDTLIPLSVNEDQILDRNRLEQLFEETGHEIIPDLIAAFLNEIQSRLNTIEDACHSKDIEQITRESHALKSCAASYGASRLSSLAKKIEIAGRNSKEHEVISMASTISSAILSTKAAINLYMLDRDALTLQQ